jgi:peptide/nickel transport system substrate-binding protein
MHKHKQRNKLRLALSLCLVTVLAFSLVACGTTAPPVTEQPGASTEEPSGVVRESLNIAMTASPPTLDTALTVSAVALDIACNVFEPLYTLDEDYQPVPMLAESVNVSDDGTIYTFVLRHGVTFHNGKEMTAKDVVASMNRWLSLSSRALSLLPGAAFSQVDDYTVELKLTEAASDTLIIIATHSQFPSIVPQEVVDSATDEGIVDYIGTGPYKFVEWRQDQYIQLTRNNDYQSLPGEPSGFSGRKSAPTKDLFFHFVTDASTRISGLKTGLYDIADSIPTENYDELDADPSVTLYTKNSGALTAFFNTREGLLANEQLRQAVLAALNDEDILLASFGNPKLFSLSPSYLNPQQAQWATDSGAQFYNQNDPQKAADLLAQAGYNGETLTLLATQDYAEMYDATLVMQEQLRQAGFTVEIATYDFPTFMETKGDYSAWNIFVASTVYQLTPPQLLALSPDFAGFDNDEAKALVQAIRQAPTQAEAKAEWERLQLFMYEYGSGSVLGHYASLVGSGPTVDGFKAFLAPIVWNASVSEA